MIARNRVLYFRFPSTWHPFLNFCLSGKTHYNFINHCNLFLSDNQYFASRRSHESHEGCIAKGSQLTALPSVINRMASTSVARALREIREICVRIKYLREDRLLKHKLLRHLFSVILTSVYRFLLVVFICCSRRAALPFAKGSAVVREEQRGRSRTANNFAL